MRLLSMMAILSVLLGSCAKEVCPGEIQAREKHVPIKTHTKREINSMARPSLIFTGKSKGGRKPPKSSPTYTAKSNNTRRPPK